MCNAPDYQAFGHKKNGAKSAVLVMIAVFVRCFLGCLLEKSDS